MIMIILIVAFIILLLVWGIATYNRLITERLKVETQWSQIDVVLKQRFDLIPNLVETVKGYTSHEKEALQAVTDAPELLSLRGRYKGPDESQRRVVRSYVPSHGCGGVLS